ncbi:hypothetical protein [Paenibacillus zanthoxyli]|uniref:hypothetical protein n=1 Tax=Paenibacillus zanthoxyli TaxID=369399 RepID=UPI00046F56D1|nr:hypothetical protein [Paenibacillus zanthoxyli]
MSIRVKSFKNVKLLAILGAVLVASSFSSVVGAAPVVKEGEVKVEQTFIVRDGKAIIVPNETYLNDSKQMETIEASKDQTKQNLAESGRNVSINSLWDLSHYNEAGYIPRVLRTPLKRRISAAVYNSTTSPLTRSLSFSTTQTYTANISITGSRKGVIDAGITGGVSWTQTATVNDTMTASIQPHEYNWVEFTPYMSNSYGTLFEEIWNIDPFTGQSVLLTKGQYWTDIYSAIKLPDGTPDGLYTVVSSASAPN